MFNLMGGKTVIEINHNDATGIWFNGVGDDAHETMCIDFTGNGKWDFCKTACKPYDCMVVACLILAKELGIIKSWESDGDEESGDFIAGKALLRDCKDALLKIVPDSNHYWVEMNLQVGECEKYGYALVIADDEKKAGKFALALECHGNAKFEGDDLVWDMNGEMAYSVRKVVKLPKGQVTVLKKHFNVFTYDESTIEAILS